MNRHVVLLLALSAACSPEVTHDLVIANGRVMDPESGLDAVRNVGILDGRIVTLEEGRLDGAQVIDATGHVVAPGFIDLHAHGQTEESYRLMVQDGITSGLELEVGTGDVAAWYAAREGGQLIHYGVSAGHIPVRMAVFGDPGDLLPAGIGGSATASPEQLAEIERRLTLGFEQGAVAAGFGSAYTPGATMDEVERMFRISAAAGAPIHIHMRNGVAGLDSTIIAAAAAGASLHIVHLNSVAGDDLAAFAAAIRRALAAGQDVTTETYPYSAGMTEIQSALFDDWRSWPDERFGQHQWVETGERLTRESFGRYRAARGGMVIIHSRTEAQTRAAIADSLTMIASDGLVQNGRGHPRTSGTYAKVLGRYVRDEGVLTLMDALRRMSLEPARRLERRVPAMANKGRIRVGADADLTIFDPAAVIDRSTYEDPTIPSAGIPWVIVAGTVVVDQGTVANVRPGRAIRAAVR